MAANLVCSVCSCNLHHQHVFIIINIKTNFSLKKTSQASKKNLNNLTMLVS